MPRDITKFKGNNVVIGCSHHVRCSGYHPDDSYYAIDRCVDDAPDLVFDITDSLPHQLQKRFQITLTENLDCDAYNNISTNSSQLHGEQGFTNIWNMTKDDGFIFINGSDRLKNYRNSIQNLKYIEISRDFDPLGCVIIPKDQSLSIEEVNEKIKSNPELMTLIKKINKFTYIPDSFVFCDIPYDSMPSLYEVYKEGKKYLPCSTEVELGLITEHRKIPEVDALFRAIEDFNTLEETKLFASRLLITANIFFKNATSIVRHDISIFQMQFALLTDTNKPKLIKNSKDFLLLIANLLIALTGIGLLAIGIYMAYAKKEYGRYLPLFFGGTAVDKLNHRAETVSHYIAAAMVG